MYKKNGSVKDKESTFNQNRLKANQIVARFGRVAQRGGAKRFGKSLQENAKDSVLHKYKKTNLA